MFRIDIQKLQLKYPAGNKSVLINIKQKQCWKHIIESSPVGGTRRR